MADFRKEFPDYPADTFPALPPTFVDSSWGNEPCPSIRSDALRLTVFLDYQDPAKREAIDDGNSRFSVHKMGADGCFSEEAPLMTTDVWQEVLDLIDDLARAQK
ncbi:MAG TPA: hypothetical protein VIU44_07965 [Gaiellaceae bacterium]